MRLPPKKPHFFKPMFPGFKNGIKIPKSFFKHLDGPTDGYAVISRESKKWKVKINGKNLEEGWKDFVDENNLHIGDFVVFRHEGNMNFEVMVFDPSCCERELLQSVEREIETAEVKGKAAKLEPPSHKFKSNDAKRKLEEKTTLEELSKVKDISLLNNRPHFLSTLKRYVTTGYNLYLPRGFAITNGLSNRHCEIILRNKEESSWPAQLNFVGGHDRINHGWRQFQIANDLKEGDSFKLELVENGDVPILKIYNTGKEKKLKLLTATFDMNT